MEWERKPGHYNTAERRTAWSLVAMLQLSPVCVCVLGETGAGLPVSRKSALRWGRYLACVQLIVGAQ